MSGLAVSGDALVVRLEAGPPRLAGCRFVEMWPETRLLVDDYFARRLQPAG